MSSAGHRELLSWPTPPAYSLDQLEVGEENRLALAAVSRAAEPAEARYSPVVLVGPPASGKSHLLYGLANRLIEKFGAARVVAAAAGEFVERCDAAWRGRGAEELRRTLWHLDAFLLDDVQSLKGHPAALAELRHVVDRMLTLGRLVVLTSRTSIAEIDALPAGVRNRLRGGLVLGMESPGETLLRKIARLRGAALGLQIGPKVAETLVAGVADVRQLIGSLRQLDQSIVRRRSAVRRVAASQVRVILGEVPAATPSIPLVAKLVAEHFRVPLKVMRSAARHTEVASARQTAMFLARETTGASLAQIGAWFGGRDHTTVRHAIAKTAELLQKDVQLGRALQTLRRAIRSAAAGR